MVGPATLIKTWLLDLIFIKDSLLWKGSFKRFNLDTPENAVVTLVTASLLGKKLNAINFM